MPKIWRDYEALPEKERLPSDSCHRGDLQLLEMGDVETGQSCKEKIEDLQRDDAKLREAAKERRQQGGPKIVFDKPQLKDAISKNESPASGQEGPKKESKMSGFGSLFRKK